MLKTCTDCGKEFTGKRATFCRSCRLKRWYKKNKDNPAWMAKRRLSRNFVQQNYRTLKVWKSVAIRRYYARIERHLDIIQQIREKIKIEEAKNG